MKGGSVKSRRPVTIHEVAKKAGVAVSSVSRVLSNHPDVSTDMKRKVEDAARELGYFPDPVAQSLRRGSSRLIGYVVRDFATPFFSDVIEGLETVLNKSGYTLLVTNGGGSQSQELDRITMLKRRRVDGLLLSTFVDSTTKLRRAVESFGKPVVLVDRDIADIDVGRSLFNHVSGVEAATLDLVNLGHTSIALVTGTPDVRPTRERIKGFRKGLQVNELAAERSFEVTGVFSAAFARKETTSAMTSMSIQRPTAIISGGVQATIGVLESFSELGIQPGRDVALVVVDDLPWLRILRPRISAVSRDAEAMGRAAGNMLLAQIEGVKPSTVFLPTSYESRDTSTPLNSLTATR